MCWVHFSTIHDPASTGPKSVDHIHKHQRIWKSCGQGPGLYIHGSLDIVQAHSEFCGHLIVFLGITGFALTWMDWTVGSTVYHLLIVKIGVPLIKGLRRSSEPCHRTSVGSNKMFASPSPIPRWAPPFSWYGLHGSLISGLFKVAHYTSIWRKMTWTAWINHKKTEM